MDIEKVWITFDGDKIQADLYHPDDQNSSDIIIMAHGLGGEKACGLGKFADFYSKLGYRVCVFDHRGFGQSTGPVKNLVDKNSQITDWKAVIQYLINEHQIDPLNMILWGYSFSGAHALTLASESEYKAVIANFPHADGLASLTLYPKKYLLPATLIAMQDLIYSASGKIKTMPVVAKNRFAVLAGADCYEGYHSIIPKNIQWDNAVPARIIATIGLYRPTTIAHKIKCPTFVAGAAQDSLIPIRATQKLALKIPNGVYEEHQCGHFGLFHDPVQTKLLKQHQKFLSRLS